MTQKEKARAYDEALDRCKEWVSGTWGHSVDDTPKDVAEFIFPQLAESEDEKMVVKIARTLSFAAAHNLITNYDELIAMQNWLEKQKDLDKMIVVSPEVWDKAIAEAYENGKKDGEKQKEPENVSASTMIPSCWEIKQKEQKPDSLIYDKDLDKAAREFYLSGGADSPVDSTGLVPIVRMAEFGATWMKERMEKEQKPAEWSAKGRRGRIGSTPEHIRKKAENFLSKMEPPYDADDICSAYETGAMENANSSWSEEDERMLRTIISDGSRGVELDSKQISWLKSLRPSWKPSEVQMAMLLAVINDPNNAGAESCQLALRELYNQLKGLKEGEK